MGLKQRFVKKNVITFTHSLEPILCDFVKVV